MAIDRYAAVGNAEVFFVATVSNDQAPTTAELNAGIDLTVYLTDGGFDSPLDGSLIDVADISSRFNKTIIGPFGGQPLVFEGWRGKINDLAYSTLQRDVSGYFAFTRQGLAAPGTFAVADVIHLWPIEVMSRNPVPMARNAGDRFIVQCGVPGEPLEDFAIAI